MTRLTYFSDDITCNADTDKTVTFTAVSLFGAPARFAYIFDCASTMGENGGSGYPGSIGGGFVTSEDFNIPDCNLEWVSEPRPRPVK